MNARSIVWYTLLTSSTVANGIIAWGLYASLPIVNPTPAQVLLYKHLPDLFWPGIFALCSLTGLIGMGNIPAVRVHFGLASTTMMVWGIIGISFATSPITFAGGVLLIHMAILKFTLMWHAPRLIKSYRSMNRLTEQLNSATNELDLKETMEGADTREHV